jgi:peptidyl-prolyl cis-trans isomerase C
MRANFLASLPDRLLRILVLAVTCISVISPTEAAAPGRNLAIAGNEHRVALVIGNAAYTQGPLANPVNDARAMAKLLRSLGFDVVLRENLKVRDIGSVYREFRSKVTPGGVALVFYAGHGVQFKGQNYFPAIDADLHSEDDVPLQSLNLGNLLDNMEEAKAGVGLVFLDACRDNPFMRRFRSATRGLAKAEAASGTLIHYATKPGSVASDGDGKNGTYTEALLAMMSQPGVPVEQMLKRVANRVVDKTKGKQEPWVEGNLRGDFYFVFQGPTMVGVQQSAVDSESEAWRMAEGAGNVAAMEAYLKEYPNGNYASAARIKISALTESKPAQNSNGLEKPVNANLPRGDVLAKVNGQAIPKMVGRALIDGQIAQGKSDTDELRKAVTEELVRRTILTQEAVKNGLGQFPNVAGVKTSIDGQSFLAQQGVLIGAYLNDYVRTHPVTDEQVKKEYAEISAKLGNKEYKARHILVEKEDEAKAIIAKLTKGEKIEDLAKDSKDPGSKDRGGDLGWANPASFLPPFSAAMIKLEKGKFTETPVKSDFGWHVIQLEDTRELKLPGIEEAKAQIGQQLTQRMVQKHIDELRAKAKVE